MLGPLSSLFACFLAEMEPLNLLSNHVRNNAGYILTNLWVLSCFIWVTFTEQMLLFCLFCITLHSLKSFGVHIFVSSLGLIIPYFNTQTALTSSHNIIVETMSVSQMGEFFSPRLVHAGYCGESVISVHSWSIQAPHWPQLMSKFRLAHWLLLKGLIESIFTQNKLL